MTILLIILTILALLGIGAVAFTWYADKIEEDERKDENYEEY